LRSTADEVSIPVRWSIERGNLVTELKLAEFGPRRMARGAVGVPPPELGVLGIVASLVVALWALSAPSVSCAEPPILEYTDNTYEYSFQYPPDWKPQDPPGRSAAGETRVVFKSPRGDQVAVTVGRLGAVFSERAFQSNPRKAEVVEAMIDLTIEHVYEKRSREVGATRMLVVERVVVPHEAGVIFYVNTANFQPDDTLAVITGVHAVPFGKSYLISFLMSGPVRPSDERANATFHEVFQSFRLTGGTPSAR
jgi:hypothetical protein